MFRLSDFKKLAGKLLFPAALAAQMTLALLPAFAQTATSVTRPPVNNPQQGNAPLLSEEERKEFMEDLSWVLENKYTDHDRVKKIVSRSYGEQVFAFMAKKRPLLFLRYLPWIEENPYAEKLLNFLVEDPSFAELAETNARGILAYISNYSEFPIGEKIIKAILPHEPRFTCMAFNDSIFNQPYGESVLLYSAKIHPVWHLVSGGFAEYRHKPWALNVLREAIKNDPGGYFYQQESLEKFLPGKEVEGMRKLAGETLPLRLEEGQKLSALQIGWTLNHLHEETDQVRFKCVENLSAEGLYFLIAHGREEIFTSTFLGLFERMTSRMEKEGRSFLDFLKNEKTRDLMPVFLEAASSYGKIGDVLNRLADEDARRTFVAGVVRAVVDADKRPSGVEEEKQTGLAGNKTVRMALTIADMLSACADKNVLRLFERELAAAYEANDDKTVRISLGLVISCYLNEKGDDGAHPNLFKEIDFKKEYPFVNLKRLSEKELFENGVCHQQMVFYDDDDGKQSFRHFLSVFQSTKKKREGWSLDDKGAFIVLSSPAFPNKARQIVIVANKPDNEAGLKAADDFLKDKNPRVLVHRGHSFHARKTFPYLRRDTAVVFWGSCGGYHNLAKTEEMAPFNHTLSTKQTGTMLVNDKLWECLCDSMLKNGEIVWTDVWKKTAQVVKDPRFKHYLPPDGSRGLRFLRSFQRLSEAQETIATKPGALPSQTMSRTSPGNG